MQDIYMRKTKAGKKGKYVEGNTVLDWVARTGLRRHI